MWYMSHWKPMCHEAYSSSDCQSQRTYQNSAGQTHEYTCWHYIEHGALLLLLLSPLIAFTLLRAHASTKTKVPGHISRWLKWTSQVIFCAAGNLMFVNNMLLTTERVHLITATYRYKWNALFGFCLFDGVYCASSSVFFCVGLFF